MATVKKIPLDFLCFSNPERALKSIEEGLLDGADVESIVLLFSLLEQGTYLYQEVWKILQERIRVLSLAQSLALFQSVPDIKIKRIIAKLSNVEASELWGMEVIL